MNNNYLTRGTRGKRLWPLQGNLAFLCQLKQTVPCEVSYGFQMETRFGGRPWLPILKNPAVRFQLLYDWLPQMRDFHTGLTGASAGTRQLLMRASVLAVALITYRFQPNLAHTFWPRLARDSGLSEGEPEWALLRYLREFNTRAVQPAIYQRTVAAAWNLFYNRRPVSKLQPRPVTQPILILGTPHDGSTHYGYLSTDGTLYKNPRPFEFLESGEEAK